MRARLADQVPSVCRDRHDVETGLSENVNDALANEWLVLPYDDSEGIVLGHCYANPTPIECSRQRPT
jgi:hypothetical protein